MKKLEKLERKLLSGNEALARGAYEAGVQVASGYPGTPSTEILEVLSTFKDELYCEWAPNEKVAMEVAIGAAITGVRAMVTMKHVGLNVAADPLVCGSYIGPKGGLVIIVADDPGMYSSQTEQDSRHYARFAKIPILEPANAQEAKDFIKLAFEISEEFETPVLVRMTTSVAHSRNLVTLENRKNLKKADFVKEPSRYVLVPNFARKRREVIEERQKKLGEKNSESSINIILGNSEKIGVISSGVTSINCQEYFPEAKILKLGWSFPFPDTLIKNFAKTVEKLIIIEENEPFLEEHIKSLGIICDGKNVVPSIGEMLPSKIVAIRNKILNENKIIPTACDASKELPTRPPVLCPSCPHRGIFFALSKFDVVVIGDIGCYSLGVFPPLNRMDTLVCMGAGVSMLQGVEKAGEKKPFVGILGDSTFYHSGITGLVNTVYNKGNSTLIIVDNRITAMTGHQEHPGSGVTLMGEKTHNFSLEKMAEACGIKRIKIVNPYNLKETLNVLKEEIAAAEPSVIISRAPCPLAIRKPVGTPKKIVQDECKNCRACLKLGCPAIVSLDKNKPYVDSLLCYGCSLCEQTCPFHAIKDVEKE